MAYFLLTQYTLTMHLKNERSNNYNEHVYTTYNLWAATYSLTDSLVPTWFKELLWTVRFQLQSQFLAQVLVWTLDLTMTSAELPGWPHHPLPPPSYILHPSLSLARHPRTVNYSGLTSCWDVKLNCAFSLNFSCHGGWRAEDVAQAWNIIKPVLLTERCQRGRGHAKGEAGIRQSPGLLSCFLVKECSARFDWVKRSRVIE